MFTLIHSVQPLFGRITDALDAFSTAQPAWSQAVGSLLVTAIWQGAVLALCLYLCLKLARNSTAAFRFSIWVSGFVAVIGLPFLQLAIHASEAASTLSKPSTGASLQSASLLQLDIRWSIGLATLWAVISLYRAAHLVADTIRLRKLWKSATRVPVANANESLPRAKGISFWPRRPLEICTTQALDRPSVIGFFAPRILIPNWLFSRLTPAELDQIVLHEAEHLRRGDDWTNLLQKIGLVLFPLNPALLWIDRQLCLEREIACDEAVVRATQAPRAYAACLTSLAEHGRAWKSQALTNAALSLGAWRRRSELVRRVHSILRSRTGSQPTHASRRSRALLALLASGLIAGLILGSVELARCPQIVSFVPSHTEQVAALPHVHPQSSASLHTPEFGASYMSNVRAIVPVRDQFTASIQGDIPVQPSTARSATVRNTGIRQPSSNPRQPLQAATTLVASAPTQETEQQGWLVMTTWEEVVTSNASTPAANQDGEIADLSSASSSPDNISNAPNSGAPKQPAAEIRVTRMIFRVVPASFVSQSPTVARTRDGWLILQL